MYGNCYLHILLMKTVFACFPVFYRWIDLGLARFEVAEWYSISMYCVFILGTSTKKIQLGKKLCHICLFDKMAYAFKFVAVSHAQTAKGYYWQLYESPLNVVGIIRFSLQWPYHGMTIG